MSNSILTVRAVLTLQERPCSSRELADILDMRQDNAAEMLRRFREADFIEFRGYVKSRTGAPACRYGWKT